MPTNTMSSFVTPPARRDSYKRIDVSLNGRNKRKEALRELGRKQRHAILQKLRGSLSPADLQGKLHADTMAAIKAQLCQPEVDGGVLTEADIEALLLDIEAQVMEEIQAELAELERQEQEQMQHEISMAEQHMQQQAAQGASSGVLCPVCKSCQLVQRHGLLVCPAEGWRVNVAAESLSMDNIQSRLAAAYQEHAASRCPGQLAFHIEDLLGSNSLTCSCATCNSLAVVV